MTYLSGDRITLNGRNGSVAVDLGGDRFGVLLDRQKRDERYEDLHVFASVNDLSPLVTPFEDEEDTVPTYDEGLVFAGEYAASQRPDLHSAVGWREDFSRWINELVVNGSNGGSNGSGGFQVTVNYEDDFTTIEIDQHVVSLYVPCAEEPEGSAFLWIKDDNGDV